MTPSELNEKISAHNKCVTEMRTMKDARAKAKEKFTEDDWLKWDRMNEEARELQAEIDLGRAELAADAIEAVEVRTEEDEKRAKELEDAAKRDPKDEYRTAYISLVRYGLSRMPDEMRTRVLQGAVVLTDDEKRALSTVENNTGGLGYQIPELLHNGIEKYSLLFGGMEQVSKIITTAKGGRYNYTFTDNTGQTGEWLAENTAATELDPTIDEVVFNDYTVSSKIVLQSLQSLHDVSFDAESWIKEVFGERMGRTKNTAYTLGDGSGKPTGFLPNVGTVAAANAAILTYDDFVNLMHGPDASYRIAGVARFMLNDAALKAVKLIKDGDGRPIFMKGLADSGMSEGAPGTILGFPYTINQDMPNVATGNRAVAFGDFQKYVIRKVNQTGMLRLSERYAEKLQVGFLAFQRVDGKLLNPNAIKALLMA